MLVEEAQRLKKKDFAAWQVQSASIRAQHGVPKSLAAWTGRANLQLLGVPASPRVLNLLDTLWAVRVHKSPSHVTAAMLRDGFWCDVSQAHNRQSPMSCGPPTWTSTTAAYSFSEDRVVSGKGAMRVLGHPNDRMSGDLFSEAQLKDLAGQGCSVPCCVLIASLMYSNPYGEWWMP